MPWTVLPDNTLRQLTDDAVRLLLQNAPMPTVFLTGDAHRNIVFGWTNSCEAVRTHFALLVASNSLILHVEEPQANITRDSVPALLRPCFDQGHMFGWEPSVMAALAAPLEACNLVYVNAEGDYSPTEGNLARARVFFQGLEILHPRLGQIGNPPHLFGALQTCRAYIAYSGPFNRQFFKATTRNPAIELSYATMVNNFRIDAMAQRTGAHQYLGPMIRNRMLQYPDCTHLITVGNAHLINNPIQHHIPLPPGEIGVVDAAQTGDC